ncbi:serine proteinase inhibitor [Ancylostoma duodenale]|uniref:Serine proteinase inhibitor n=1 Tax=Ancylostoma duodenale TaxID=51022 RepID=A0A0C2GLC3_9BILA|nr:serine proteinase inhibitor [Ancylostoma duodenale]
MASYYRSTNQSTVTFLTAETDFGLKLLHQTSINETLVVSPLSVILALAAIQMGAKGTTRTQINQAISVGATEIETIRYYSHLSEEVRKQRMGTRTEIANGIFMDKKVAVRKSYGLSIVKKFSSKVKSLRFSRKEVSVDRYVSYRTTGRIRHINTPSRIQDALSLLVSAASFTSQWEYSFVRKSNTFATFYSAEHSERKVEFMNVIKQTRYYAEDQDMQVLSLRYRDTSYALNIFLPKQKSAFSTLRAKLTGAAIQASLSQLKSTYVSVREQLDVEGFSGQTASIPKMRIVTEFKLKAALMALGVSELFSEHCDLGGITKSRAVKVSFAEHKAIIEGGTTEEESDSAYKPTLVSPMSGEPISFIADHPFFFVLTKDKNPLFIGQYV